MSGLGTGLISRFTPSGGMGARIVKSGIWMTALRVSDRMLQLVMLVVLSRLLGPADFGLMGIALLSLAVFKQFSDLGVDQALIQRREDDISAFMNTAWVLEAGRGALIAVVAYLSAPYVAGFFSEPRALPVLQVLALAPLLTGLRNPHIVYLRKDLQFHREFVYRVSGTLAQVGVAVGLALLWGNVWALVFGFLAGEFVRSLVSYLMDARRPGLGFSWHHAKELYSFGKWITGYSVLAFLFTHGDDAFVGWLLGAAALGAYQIAYRLANAPGTEVTGVVTATLLPAYAKLQEDAAALRSAYFRVLQVVSVLSAPMAAGIVVVTPLFVRVVLGPEWELAIVPMQLLVVWGFMLSIGSTSGPLLKAVGRPDYITKVNFLKTVALAVLIWPLSTEYGVAGTAAAVVLAAALTSEPAINWIVLRTINGSGRQFVRTVGVPLAAAGVMAGVLVAAQSAGLVPASALGLIGLVVGGMITYAAAMLVAEVVVGYGLREQVQFLRRRIGA